MGTNQHTHCSSAKWYESLAFRFLLFSFIINCSQRFSCATLTSSLSIFVLILFTQDMMHMRSCSVCFSKALQLVPLLALSSFLVELKNSITVTILQNVKCKRPYWVNVSRNNNLLCSFSSDILLAMAVKCFTSLKTL